MPFNKVNLFLKPHIRVILFERRITVSRAAEYCGVDISYMSRVLNSDKPKPKPISPNVLRKLAKLLKMRQSDLIVSPSPSRPDLRIVKKPNKRNQNNLKGIEGGGK